MPGETPEQVKERPVSLGAEAWERMWPEMVFPSDLPSNVPFALNTKMESIYSSSQDESGHQIVHNDFQFPQEVNLFSAGTLGKIFSFFGELTWGERPDGGSDTEFGGSFLGGIQINPKFAFEAKLGLGDVPDWKFLLVWR